MAKRRTSGVQRRRASTEAMGRRLDTTPRRGGIDVRILAIVGFLAVGLVVLVVAVVLAAAPNPYAGQPEPNDGQGHIPQCTPGDYSSNPPTSGCHDSTPGSWGVYTSPLAATAAIHNLEHGGIVIWYQEGSLDAASIQRLADFVNNQVATGIGGRFKFILSPWSTDPFPDDHPIAVTAWRRLLYLDEANVDAIRSFADANYQRAPENAGGPAPPS